MNLRILDEQMGDVLIKLTAAKGGGRKRLIGKYKALNQKYKKSIRQVWLQQSKEFNNLVRELS